MCMRGPTYRSVYRERNRRGVPFPFDFRISGMSTKLDDDDKDLNHKFLGKYSMAYAGSTVTISPDRCIVIIKLKK